MSVYEPAGREYRLRYLEPPWELVASEGTTAFVRVRSNAQIFGGLEAGVGKYELVVTVEPGEALSRVSGELAAATARGETFVEGPRQVFAEDEVAGLEILTSVDGPLPRRHRYVFFPLSGGRVVRLAFEATPELDTPEVAAMIGHFGVGAP